eukprot:11225048-Lingulodinium_polyedra.AAC.1
MRVKALIVPFGQQIRKCSFHDAMLTRTNEAHASMIGGWAGVVRGTRCNEGQRGIARDCEYSEDQLGTVRHSGQRGAARGSEGQRGTARDSEGQWGHSGEQQQEQGQKPGTGQRSIV